MTEEPVSIIDLFKDALPLLGVIVGAALQYFFGRSAESERHERTLRVEAYSDYLRSVGEMESMKTSPDPAYKSAVIAQAIAAKARVCVHGSSSVVKALSKFEGSPGQGLTGEKKRLFLEFVEAVRTDTGTKGAELPQANIEKILFESKE